MQGGPTSSTNNSIPTVYVRPGQNVRVEGTVNVISEGQPASNAVAATPAPVQTPPAPAPTGKPITLISTKVAVFSGIAWTAAEVLNAPLAEINPVSTYLRTAAMVAVGTGIGTVLINAAGRGAQRLVEHVVDRVQRKKRSAAEMAAPVAAQSMPQFVPGSVPSSAAADPVPSASVPGSAPALAPTTVLATNSSSAAAAAAAAAVLLPATPVITPAATTAADSAEAEHRDKALRTQESRVEGDVSVANSVPVSAAEPTLRP
jgi:hypothetical protein